MDRNQRKTALILGAALLLYFVFERQGSLLVEFAYAWIIALVVLYTIAELLWGVTRRLVRFVKGGNAQD